MTLRAFCRLGIAAIWIASIAGAIYGLNQLETHAAVLARAQPCRLIFDDVPPWLSEDWQYVLADVQRIADVRPEDDVLDPTVCSRVAEALRSSPWVREVRRVTKTADGQVHVDAVFRQPLAAVVVKNIVYMIDDQGVRLPLPGRYSADDVNVDKFFTIIGVRGPVPREGESWRDTAGKSADDLAAAIALVKFLEARNIRQLPLRSELRAIDVGNWELRENKHDAQVRIRTIYPKTYIQWGLPPGKEEGIDPSSQQKLELLLYLHEKKGRLPEDKIINLRVPEGGLEPPPG